jgi:hypothetical protein
MSAKLFLKFRKKKGYRRILYVYIIYYKMENIENLKEQLAVLNKKAEPKPKPKTKCKNTKEYALAYYHKQHSIRCVCVCGKETTMTSIYSHRFSKKHILIMERMEIEKKIKALEECQIVNL